MSCSFPSPPRSDAGSIRSRAGSFISDAGFSSDDFETASASSAVPRDEVETMIASARRQEERNRPATWFNPDQTEEVNGMQELLHDEALQDFCAWLTVPGDDPQVLHWSALCADEKYDIFHKVYVAVYEQRKDIFLQHERRYAIVGAYVDSFRSAVLARNGSSSGTADTPSRHIPTERPVS